MHTIMFQHSAITIKGTVTQWINRSSKTQNAESPLYISKPNDLFYKPKSISELSLHLEKHGSKSPDLNSHRNSIYKCIYWIHGIPKDPNPWIHNPNIHKR